MRVIFVIRSLTCGGAERQLVNAAVGLANRGHDISVAVFYSEGSPLERELTTAGVTIESLGKRNRWDLIGPFRRMRAILRRQPRAVVYSFLPTANLFSAAVACSLKHRALVWGIRVAGMEIASDDPLARCLIRLEHLLIWVPQLVITNSDASRERIQKLRPGAKRVLLIRNGIDTIAFTFTEQGRKEIRAQLGVGESDVLVGAVGRIVSQKNLSLLFKAASLAHHGGSRPFRVVVAGDGEPGLIAELLREAARLGVAERVKFIGQRTDLPRVYSALDVLCLCSDYEGTSNVLLESLSCGTTCVATDVGDSAKVIGDGRLIAAPGDAVGLAACLHHALGIGGPGSRVSNRARATSLFSLVEMIQVTEQALIEVKFACAH